VTDAEKAFIEFLDANYANTLADIRKSGQLSDESKKALGESMERFRAAHTEHFRT